MSSMCSHVSFLAMLAGCPSNLPGACGLWAGPIPMPPSAEATTRDRVDSLFLLCCLLLLKCIYIYIYMYMFDLIKVFFIYGILCNGYFIVVFRCFSFLGFIRI